MKKICIIEDCNKKHYAKKWCRKHYELNRRYGRLHTVNHKPYKGTHCKVENCNSPAVTKDYCTIHYVRFRRNGITEYIGKYGERNPRWNGGIFKYPNHMIMKKNRIIKMKEVGGKCEICDESARHIHHKDENKSNHSLKNLIALCVPCHGVIHSGRKNKKSKFIKLYGMTISQLADSFNINCGNIYRMHRAGKLAAFIKSKGGIK